MKKFLGPAEPRAEVDQKNKLHYIESIESTGSGNVFHGVPEILKGKDALKLSRKLAGLVVAGGERSVVLPSTVRITSILNEDPLNIDTIISNWRVNTHDNDQMLLPVGQYVDRTGLSTYEIDFRPETLGGKGCLSRNDDWYDGLRKKHFYAVHGVSGCASVFSTSNKLFYSWTLKQVRLSSKS